MKTMLIDLTKCVGCYGCQIACKDEHCDQAWLPYAQAQPDTGQFWMHVIQEELGARPHVKVSYLPTLCQHCEKPACMAACAEGAITQRDDGLVIIDPEKCTGCRACVDACPYGTVYFNEDLNIAQKCTGCAHLIDGGHTISVPRCFDNCPALAISWAEEDELDLEGAEKLHPEYGTAPRLWYKGLPKPFVAGTVYDPVEEELVIGAKVRLAGDGGSFELETNKWGDFWFKDVPEGAYEVTIEHGGKSKVIPVQVTEKCVGLKDIPLE